MKTDSFDGTDQYRFLTEEEAISFAKAQVTPGMVVKLEQPEYSDKPFMFVAYEWIHQFKETI